MISVNSELWLQRNMWLYRKDMAWLFIYSFINRFFFFFCYACMYIICMYFRHCLTIPEQHQLLCNWGYMYFRQCLRHPRIVFSYCVTEDELECLFLWSLPPQYRDYRNTPQWPVLYGAGGLQVRVLCWISSWTTCTALLACLLACLFPFKGFSV